MIQKFPGNQQYNYNAWSPPAQSNDNTNGFFLERSNSARKVLERAMELCPEEVYNKKFKFYIKLFSKQL